MSKEQSLNKKEIVMPKPEKIYLKNLVFDPTNPNEMSEELEEGLFKLLQDYGFYGSIIVAPKDKDGKQLIHHGEHRVRKLLEAGNKWVWGAVKQMTKADHIMFRQGMNRTTGVDDLKKLAMNYATLSRQKLEVMSIYAGQPVEQLIIEKEAVIVNKDTLMVKHHEDTFLHGNLKQLYFIFTNEVYEKLMPRLDKIKEHAKVDNNTDMFMKMVKAYEDYHLKKKK